ncbi:MAG: hypothetical protein JWN88_1610 [Frankiales bacterium]|nr:hypothetical protein [Frankiales bacterium]
MDVRIEELTTAVHAVDPEALLTPAVLGRVVEAVLARLAANERDEQSRGRELDLRSVVEQQRAGRA